MKTEKANVADLMLDPSNVRKHSAENLNAIKASLAKFGQQKPIVADKKGVVVAGNGQLMAAIPAPEVFQFLFVSVIESPVRE